MTLSSSTKYFLVNTHSIGLSLDNHKSSCFVKISLWGHSIFWILQNFRKGCWEMNFLKISFSQCKRISIRNESGHNMNTSLIWNTSITMSKLCIVYSAILVCLISRINCTLCSPENIYEIKLWKIGNKWKWFSSCRLVHLLPYDLVHLIYICNCQMRIRRSTWIWANQLPSTRGYLAWGGNPCKYWSFINNESKQRETYEIWTETRLQM